MAKDWTTTDWTVIAYVGPQTAGKDNDRCVHLYPDIPGGARYHCATVYEERFDELPYGIGEEMMTAPVLPGTAPTPEQAKSQGIFQPCAPFVIQTWVREDGAKTKKLAHILGPDVKATPEHSVPAGRSLQQAVQGLEWNPVPLEEVSNQFAVIVAETMKKVKTLEAFFDFDALEEDDDAPTNGFEWNKFLFSLAWRDANDQYRVVRPALLAPKLAEESQDPDPYAILDGERALFLQDVAEQHKHIESDDEAKRICKIVGITGSAEEAKLRLSQARRIWLFADLVNEPYNASEAIAAELANNAYPDEVPF